MICFLNEPSMAYFWSFSNNNTMVTINKWEHFFIKYLLLGFELTTSHTPITIGTRCLLLERVQKNCEKCNKIVLPNSNLKYFYLFVAFGRALNNKNSITNTGNLIWLTHRNWLWKGKFKCWKFLLHFRPKSPWRRLAKIQYSNCKTMPRRLAWSLPLSEMQVFDVNFI